MGLSQKTYVLAWMLYFILNGLIITVVFMLITKFLIITDGTKFAEGYGFWDIVFLYFLFSLSNIGYVLLISCFFSKAKTGSQAITFIQLMINFLYFLRFADAVAKSSTWVTILAIFPQLCFNMTVSRIAFVGNRSI